MNKIKMIAGIIVLGSIWGFAECIIGPALDGAGLPSGSILTGIFAIGLMTSSRLLYKQRGMQIGMGFVAGVLRFFNPFGGCVICSAIAIASEGIIFELIWYTFSFDLHEFKKQITVVSIGIISSYICFVGGYIITQILTPIAVGATFYLSNLIVFIPQILSRGLIAAIIGGVIVPTVFILRNVNIYNIKDRVYYPVTAIVTIFCWVTVLLNPLVTIGA